MIFQIVSIKAKQEYEIIERKYNYDKLFEHYSREDEREDLNDYRRDRFFWKCCFK